MNDRSPKLNQRNKAGSAKSGIKQGEKLRCSRCSYPVNFRERFYICPRCDLTANKEDLENYWANVNTPAD